MGTPDFAVESLKSLQQAGNNILAVVTNIDKPRGRGNKVLGTPVKEYAIEHNIKIYQPFKVRDNVEFINEMEELKPDLFCVVAYGKILPQELLDIPKYGSVNVHGSLLPKYRGAAPIQWAILNGDKTTGVTTMFMEAGMDTGDMILKEKVEIGENETTGELWTRLAKIGGKLLVETVDLIEKGEAPREKQNDKFSMAPMLKKEMAQIDWENRTAREIKNLVRGLNPIMGAYSTINGKKIKFWKVNVIEEKTLYDMFPDLSEYSYKMREIIPGTVLFSGDKNGLYIKTIDGIIEAVEVQAENSKKMHILEFLRGNNIQAGHCNEHTNGITTPVKAYPLGRATCGAWDMCSNTWEMTESEYNDGRNRFCILKGGSSYKAEGSDWYFDGGIQTTDFAAKQLLLYPGIDRCSTVGFRCVIDLKK